MAHWKKPFRSFGRGLRRTGVYAPFKAIKIPKWLVLFSRVTFFGVILSIVPGLAHLIQRRFKSIRWWVAVWLILIPLTLFLYGGLPGLLLLGLALAVHVWIALHSSFLKGNDTLTMRFVVFLLALALYYFLYTRTAGLIFYDIQRGHAIVSSPAQHIEVGDYLLGWRSPPEDPDYPRGSLIYANLRQFGGRRNPFFEPRFGGYVQVIGLEGEDVQIQNDTFFINEKPLDPDAFPVPQWMRGLGLSTKVPPGCYFISAEFTGTGYNAQIAAELCTVSEGQIEAQALLRWWPIWRRGFIRTDE